MKIRHMLAGTAFALAFGIASPALAQNSGVGEEGPGNADNNTVMDESLNDFLDYLSNNLNGDNRENENTSSSGGSILANRGSSVDTGNRLVATQQLSGVNYNEEQVVDLHGEGSYNSGSNSVNDAAFAAFAGILNQSFNTGINNNVQSATNIAAQGTVVFGTPD